MRKRGELIALVLLVAFIVAVLGLVKQDDNAVTRKLPQTIVRSSYASFPEGYKALYLTLQELRYPVRRQIRPYTLLPERGLLVMSDAYTFYQVDLPAEVGGEETNLPKTATFGQTHPEFSPYEGRKLLQWVRRGNCAFLAVEHHPDAVFGLFTKESSKPEEETEESKEVSGWITQFEHEVKSDVQTASLVGENPLTQAPELRIKSRYRFPEKALLPREIIAQLGEVKPLYRDKAGVVAVYSQVGEGAIIWCCSPWSFSNDGISEGHNLDLILALANRQPGRQVVFDEYHHGYGAEMSVWDLLPVQAKFGVVQLTLALLLLLMTLAWRFGPPRLPAEERFSRSRAEYLMSMASLLLRAKATHIVRDRLESLLRREVGRRLGVPQRAEPAAFLAANAAHTVVDKEGLERLFQQLAQLKGQERPEQEALLRLSRETHRLLHRRTR